MKFNGTDKFLCSYRIFYFLNCTEILTIKTIINEIVILQMKNSNSIIKRYSIKGCFIALLIFFHVNTIYAQEPKPSVVIYNLEFNYDKEATTDNKNYNSYSYIIAETIAKKLLESEKYSIKRNRTYISQDFDINNETLISKKDLKDLEALPEYIIYGDYEISEKTLFVTIYVYSIENKKIATAFSEQDETGIYLLKTTEELSSQIESIIDRDYAQKAIIAEKPLPVKTEEKPRKEDTKKAKDSPFAFLEKPLSIITVGFDYGKGTFNSPWNDVLDDCRYYSPYISLDIFPYVSIGFKMDYLHGDNDDRNLTYHSDFIIYGTTAFIQFQVKPVDLISLYFCMGAGTNKTQIIYNAQMPFIPPLQEVKSRDTSGELNAGLQLNLSSLIIRGGFLYKRIFYSMEPMDLKIIYCGAGIDF